MNCLFDEEKECPLGGKIILENMGRFCSACFRKESLKIAQESLERAKESLKIAQASLSRTGKISEGTKASLILGLLAMFPKEEAKAKLEYQKLMKRVEEW